MDEIDGLDLDDQDQRRLPQARPDAYLLQNIPVTGWQMIDLG